MNDYLLDEDESQAEFLPEDESTESEQAGPNLDWLKALIILLVLLIPAILAVIEALTRGSVQVHHELIRPTVPWLQNIVNF